MLIQNLRIKQLASNQIGSKIIPFHYTSSPLLGYDKMRQSFFQNVKHLRSMRFSYTNQSKSILMSRTLVNDCVAINNPQHLKGTSMKRLFHSNIPVSKVKERNEADYDGKSSSIPKELSTFSKYLDALFYTQKDNDEKTKFAKENLIEKITEKFLTRNRNISGYNTGGGGGSGGGGRSDGVGSSNLELKFLKSNINQVIRQIDYILNIFAKQAVSTRIKFDSIRAAPIYISLIDLCVKADAPMASIAFTRIFHQLPSTDPIQSSSSSIDNVTSSDNNLSGNRKESRSQKAGHLTRSTYTNAVELLVKNRMIKEARDYIIEIERYTVRSFEYYVPLIAYLQNVKNKLNYSEKKINYQLLIRIYSDIENLYNPIFDSIHRMGIKARDVEDTNNDEYIKQLESISNQELEMLQFFEWARNNKEGKAMMENLLSTPSSKKSKRRVPLIEGEQQQDSETSK